MRKYRMKGPGGDWMVTVAPSPAKARSNLRYRLVSECGMSWYDAARFDMRDLEAV